MTRKADNITAEQVAGMYKFGMRPHSVDVSFTDDGFVYITCHSIYSNHNAGVVLDSRKAYSKVQVKREVEYFRESFNKEKPD